jgi:Icc-related predicted phosphoesterase
MVNRGAEIKKYWDMIDKDTDVLITHGPPYGILDYTPLTYNKDHHVGCEELLRKLNALKIKVHIFGHIHYSCGKVHRNETTFVNASVMNEDYEVVNKPVVVEI